MRLNSFLMTGLFLTIAATAASSAQSDDTLTTLPTAKTKQAEKAMWSACKKEFPDHVAGKSLDDVDHWAEAQESAATSTQFKQSRCYATHEAWEKLAQRNEWAVTNPPEHPTRLPASTNSH